MQPRHTTYMDVGSAVFAGAKNCQYILYIKKKPKIFFSALGLTCLRIRTGGEHYRIYTILFMSAM